MMNSLRRLNILLSLLIIGLSALAQINISGTVRDFDTKVPIDSAHIQIEIFNKRKVVIDAFTDKQGRYDVNIPFNLPEGDYPVTIKKPGIYDLTGIVRLNDGATRDFFMRYRVEVPNAPFGTPPAEPLAVVPEAKKDTQKVAAPEKAVPEVKIETPPALVVPVVVPVVVIPAVTPVPEPNVEQVIKDTIPVVSEAAQAVIPAPVPEVVPEPVAVEVEPIPAVVPEPIAAPQTPVEKVPVAAAVPVVPVIMPIKEGAVVQVNNIYFNANAIFLKPASFEELDKIAAFLLSTPNIKVEIGGHTNGLCDDAFCQYLSEGRAKAVKDYLISKKVPAAMVSHKGYGKKFPISTNATLNQRVEMKIVEVN